MSSLKKRIEDAVITILNGGSFSSEFTAVRGPRSLKKLLQTETLQVIVAAVPQKRNRLGRDRNLCNFAIGVGVFHKVGFDDNEEINPVGLEAVQLLAEEIADALDVVLEIEGAIRNGVLTPEVDYEPDDGQLMGKGVATAQVNSEYLVEVMR